MDIVWMTSTTFAGLMTIKFAAAFKYPNSKRAKLRSFSVAIFPTAVATFDMVARARLPSPF